MLETCRSTELTGRGPGGRAERRFMGQSDTSSEFAGVREEDAELARRRLAIGCFAVARKPVW